jgi:hypothetical protein
VIKQPAVARFVKLDSRLVSRLLIDNSLTPITAARAALRRKKQHEHTLEQTVAQIATLEQQIYSIEAANINRETLAAMEKAGQAMKQIHGKLSIETVDETMYVIAGLRISGNWLTLKQGETQGAARAGRGDCECDHICAYWRTCGRGRAQ